MRKTNIISLTYYETVNKYTNKYLNKSSNKSSNKSPNKSPNKSSNKSPNKSSNKSPNKSSNKSPNIIITDTSLIVNKLGIDNIGYNPQLPKHKTSKISLICDSKGIPLDANIYSPFGPIRL